jgi:hypothetical protein
VAHQAHASLEIERSGYGKHRPDNPFAANAGFHSQVLEEIKERSGIRHRRVRRTDDGAEAEVRGATHRSGNVAAANIERKNAALKEIGHRKHRKPRPMRAFPNG